MGIGESYGIYLHTNFPQDSTIHVGTVVPLILWEMDDFLQW